MTENVPALAASAEAYPHSWDPLSGEVALVRFSEADFQRASFLDQRALSPASQGWRVHVDTLAEAVSAAGLQERLGFIFHIGHVGSTLLSRLLGASPLVLSLREPLPLRTLGQLKADLATPESYISSDDYERSLTLFSKLWSRTFRPGQTSIVKATSFASECATDIVERPSNPPALLMYAAPQAYVSGILAGPNSRMEARAVAQARLRRLHARLEHTPFRLHAMSEGERIAMGWAAEMTALAAAAQVRPEQTAWLDFDRFLAAPGERLGSAFARFGLSPTASELDAIVAGPLMRQYAKAPEHAYDARLRAEVLASGRAESGEDLRAGLAWLEQAGKDHSLIGQALEIAGGS